MMAMRSGDDIGSKGGALAGSGNASAAGSDGLVIIYNVIANRSVPIVFILVSSLIIANISCDQVGSTNELDLAPVGPTDGFDSSLAPLATSSGVGGGANGSAGPPAKYDPLSMLREIYLDHNSKVITLLSSPASNSVQKFHPNGRYGRRSVDNFAEAPGAHMELAKLRFGGAEEEGSSPLRSLLQAASDNDLEQATSNKQQDHLRWLPTYNNNKQRPLSARHKQVASGGGIGDKQMDSLGSANVDQATSYRHELNKLLKCNYSGVSNLFWCDS